MAEEIARFSQNPLEPLEYPPSGAFGSASVVTGLSKTELNLARGGAAGTLTLTGVNFTSADNVTASTGDITVTEAYDSSTQISLSITAAGGCAPGDYNLLFNGDVLTPRGILKVR